MIRVELPIQAVSVANLREHWSKRAKRARIHRQAAVLALHGKKPPAGPVTVRMTRVGARLLDDDNLASSLKACRDGIADWLGRDDGDRSITWVPAQMVGPKPCVLVEVTA